MPIQLIKDSDNQIWNNYVRTHPDSDFYHMLEWKFIIEQTFSHKTCFLISISGQGKVDGILPLVWMKNTIFGNFLVSLPFLNYGGILSSDSVVGEALLSKAISIGKECGVDYIELRHRVNKQFNLPVKTAKVTMLLNLPDNSDSLFKGFKSKLRSQIKKPEKEGLTSVIGGLEQLDNFYYVFARNMRDLGTPVYEKNFFFNILRTFPGSTKICTVLKNSLPVASGLLVFFKNKVEMPWASSLRKYNHLSSNMMLYWNVLKYACDNGFRQFDFGRSTPNEGTFNFKKQWGAEPLQLYWYYWLSKTTRLPELNIYNPRYKLGISIWQHLPVCITNFIGPKVIKHIP